MAVSLPHDKSFAAFSWFTELQRSCVLQNGIVPEWFHGVISRKAAEEKLTCKPPGYFLIRVSESRVGYTLSYRGEDRCRHFMIDMLPGNQYVIVGEKQHHNSLHDLVTFHQRTPIAPYSQLLTLACEQADVTKYAELLFPQKKDIKAKQTAWRNFVSQAQVSPHLKISELSPNPPTLPTCPPTGLYPCLETELSTVNLQIMPTKPVPKPRTICKIFTTSAHEIPPQLPPRDCLPSHPHTVVEVDRSPGLMKVCSEKHQSSPSMPAEDKGAGPKHQQQTNPALKSLAQMKRKLKKKYSQSEDHTYEEISNECKTFSALESVSLSPRQTMGNDVIQPEDCTTVNCLTSDGVPDSAEGQLPLEYLNPPPFAPGY